MNRETICAVVRDLLPSYLDGLTEEATNAFIEQHLAECEQCRAVRRSMMEIVTPEEQAQAEFLDRLRRARIRRVRRRWCIFIAVIALLAVCLLPLPRSINREGTALRWRAGHPDEECAQVGVSIRGIYMDYLLFNDYFDGDVMIEGVEITQREGALTRVRMDQEGYLAYTDAAGMLRSTGFIVAPAGFEEFAICLYDYDEGEKHGSWSGDNGIVLTWQAADREAAVQKTRRIVGKHCGWLAGSVWEAGISREEWEQRKEK